MAELKLLPDYVPEPETKQGGSMTLQSSVRPLITLIMTVVFAAIIIGAAFGLTAPGWEAVYTIFMATYGAILGLWFGERSALKIPGKTGGNDESKG